MTDFVPFVPGTRADSRRNQAALALLKTGATEVVVVEEPIKSYRVRGRSQASASASAKTLNFKKTAEKAGFKVHAFTRPSSDEGDPVSIFGVVQVLQPAESAVAVGTAWVQEAKAAVDEAAKVEAEQKAKRSSGRPVNDKQRAAAERAVDRYLAKRWYTPVAAWPKSKSADLERDRRSANATGQRVREALKRRGVEGAAVSVRNTASAVTVVIRNKK